MAPVTWQTAAMFPPVVVTVGRKPYPRSLVGTQTPAADSVNLR